MQVIAGLDSGERLELVRLRRLAASACVCEQLRSSESALYGRRGGVEAWAAQAAQPDETDYTALACLLGDPHVYELRADLVCCAHISRSDAFYELWEPLCSRTYIFLLYLNVYSFRVN